MRTISRILTAVAMLAVAGCAQLPGGSLGSTVYETPSFLKADVGGAGFSGALASEYQGLAKKTATKNVNWIDASAYAQKGIAASAGENVGPWEPAALGLSGEADSLYQQTVAAISANSAARPAECAKLQATYDLLVGTMSKHDFACDDPDAVRKAWEDALAACGGAAPSAANYIVYFGFDRSDLTSAARGVLDEVVAALQGVANPVLSLVGHADTSGSAAYNEGLSKRRVDRVFAALGDLGVAVPGVTKGWRGESQPAVPTGDGVREPLNRRVEITIGNN